MNLERLRYFRVIAETGSLTESATLLSLSPAALSKAMKLLQQELGVELFRARGRNLELSTEGRKLVGLAHELFDKVALIAPTLKNSAASTSAVTRIATFEVFSTHLMGEAARRDPALALECFEAGPGEIEELVDQDQADFGLTYLPVPRAGIEFVEIARVDMAVFGHKSFARTSLEDLPFVVPLGPVRGGSTRMRGLDGWPEFEKARKIHSRVSLLETGLALCRAGRAVAYLPRFVVDLQNATLKSEFHLYEIAAPRFKNPTPVSAWLVRRKSAAETPRQRALAKLLREFLRRP